MQQTVYFLCQSLYWPCYCCTVTNLEIKHGKDRVWLIFPPHTHLNWRFIKRNGKCHGACPVLPSSSSSSTSSSPQDTHIPLPVSLSSPGASGEGIPEPRPLQSVHQREKERQTVLVFWIQHILQSCFACSILALHKAANLFSLSSAYEFELRVLVLQELFLFMTSWNQRLSELFSLLRGPPA